MSKFITTKELCEMLKVSNVTIHNYRKEGMPFEKFGTLVRFDEQKVLEWLKNRSKQREK